MEKDGSAGHREYVGDEAWSGMPTEVTVTQSGRVAEKLTREAKKRKMEPSKLAASILRGHVDAWIRTAGPASAEGWPKIPVNRPGPMSPDGSQEVARVPDRHKKRRDNDG